MLLDGAAKGYRMKGCPVCHSHNLFYVMRSVERHRFDLATFPSTDGWVDLESLVDSYADEGFEPFIECGDCNRRWTVHGEKVPVGRRKS